MNNIPKLLIICIVAIGMLTGCSDNLAEQREKNAGKGKEIIIGVPVPYEFAEKNTKFLKGLDLAKEEINTKGINGKLIKLEIADDKGIFKNAVDIAQQFSANTNMVAVIGHWYSDICIPVSSIYEEAGMLVVVPTVSNPELMEKGYNYIFQNTPSDKNIASYMCANAKKEGYKKIVIYYEESSYGKNLAAALEKEASKNGITVVDRTSGLITDMQIKRSYDKWQALDFDAVLLALNMPEGANFIGKLRKLDKDIPIISADGLDVDNFIDLLGEAAEGVVLVTNYKPDQKSPELERFKVAYVQKYNEQPDVWAIQGYDSLKLIARAIDQTGSYGPAELASYLRAMEPWVTVSGGISFNEQGEVEGRQVYEKKVVGGKFKYIE